jgi:hypothetical protein
MIFLFPLILGAWLAQSATPRAEEPRPLPELTSFLQGVRKHLHSDRIILSRYTYLEQTNFRQLDSNGKARKTEVRVYEVYPSLDEHLTYRKLISRDGKPLSAEEIEKRDRAFDKRSGERQRKLEHESADERRRREAKEAEEKRKEEENLDEAFRLYKVTMIGREQREGQAVIALAFEPRPGYQPKTQEVKVLSKLRGKAWFGETDQELIRIEAELGSTLSFGLGVLAKLNQGSQMVFQRRRVNDEIWLPSESHFTGTGRILVFKGFRVDVETVYSDYKKFSVETSISYDREKKP